jgi:ParB-like nuclease domain
MITKPRKARVKRPKHEQKVVVVDPRTLCPSYENECLYRERTTSDRDFARLVKSVRKHGVQAPLLVSRDGRIISGHQRCRAAIEAWLALVPVIVLNLKWADHTNDEWLAILREHNTGREKNL